MIVALQDLAIWSLAIALIVHTIEEGWLPEYEKVKPNWRSVVFNRSLFLDNLPNGMKLGSLCPSQLKARHLPV
jgi:hypothetical protein